MIFIVLLLNCIKEAFRYPTIIFGGNPRNIISLDINNLVLLPLNVVFLFQILYFLQIS
jgi:hypothetical protein